MRERGSCAASHSDRSSPFAVRWCSLDWPAPANRDRTAAFPADRGRDCETTSSLDAVRRRAGETRARASLRGHVRDCQSDAAHAPQASKLPANGHEDVSGRADRRGKSPLRPLHEAEDDEFEPRVTGTRGRCPRGRGPTMFGPVYSKQRGLIGQSGSPQLSPAGHQACRGASRRSPEWR